MLSVLLRHGANINAQDKKGRTLLHIVCNPELYDDRQLLIFQDSSIPLVLAAKPDCNAQDRDGQTPLHYFFKDKRIVRSDFRLRPAHADILKTMLAQGADLNLRDRQGDTPLHVLARQGSHALFSELTQEDRADPFIKNDRGETPFYLFGKSPRGRLMVGAPTASPQVDVFAAIRAGNVAALKRLLESDANLANLADPPGNTPLQAAARQGSREMIDLLLARGAVIDLVAAALLGNQQQLALADRPELLTRRSHANPARAPAARRGARRYLFFS